MYKPCEKLTYLWIFIELTYCLFIREREINNLVRRANFNTDLYVKEFGLTISNNMMEVRGRVLPPPKLQYGGRVSSLGGQVSLASCWEIKLKPNQSHRTPT